MAEETIAAEGVADRPVRATKARALVTAASNIIVALTKGHKLQIDGDGFCCAACQMTMRRLNRDWIGNLLELECPYKGTDKIDLQIANGTSLEKTLVEMGNAGIVQLTCIKPAEWESRWNTRKASTCGYGKTPIEAIKEAYDASDNKHGRIMVNER